MQSSQSVNMVSIHSADWRMCSQHWFHFEPPPLGPSPSPHVCSAHRQWETGPESLRHSCRLCDGALPLCRQGKRGQRGQALFGQQEVEGTLLPTDDTILLLNVWKITFVEYRGKNRQLVQKHVPNACCILNVGQLWDAGMLGRLTSC